LIEILSNQILPIESIADVSHDWKKLLHNDVLMNKNRQHRFVDFYSLQFLEDMSREDFSLLLEFI
jgi:hypothetical protein